MPIIRNLKAADNEITPKILQITEEPDKDQYPANASVIVSLLNELAEHLMFHLNVEDKVFYPDLLNSRNQDIAEVAKNIVK